MSPSSDPDKSLMRMREIFRQAAENSTGAGKPKFQRLSRAFNNMADMAETGSTARFELAQAEFRAAIADVQLLAKTDRDTAITFIALADALDREAKGENEAPPPPPPPKKSKGKHWEL